MLRGIMLVGVGVALVATPAIAPTPAFAQSDDEYRVIATAIDAGRLLQAREMLLRLPPVKNETENQNRQLLGARLALADNNDELALELAYPLAARQSQNCNVAEVAGIAALRTNRNELASQLLSRAVALCPANDAAWSSLGVVKDLQGDFDGAEQAYGHALRLKPKNAIYYNNLGYSLILRGKYERALSTLRTAYKLDPNSARIRNNLDIAAVSAGYALELGGPSDIRATRLNNAGVSAYLAGDRKTALRLLNDAVRTKSTHYTKAETNLAQVIKEGGSDE